MTESRGATVRNVHPSDDEGDVHVGVGEYDCEERKKEEEATKKTILGHPLYGLLLEKHIDCLKVCSGERGHEIGAIATSIIHVNDNVNPSSFDLDQFMETYCNTLNNLKEAVENPLKEASAFIDSMHAQLEELSRESNESNQAIMQESNASNQTEPSTFID